MYTLLKIPLFSHIYFLYIPQSSLSILPHTSGKLLLLAVLDCLFLPFLTSYPYTSLNFASRRTKNPVVHDGNLQREREWRKVKEPRLQSRSLGTPV